MEIKAKVALSLPNKFYKVTLRYDTYQKASYDSYLIANLIRNTESQKEAFDYIDEISGKGSLNEHFKKLYEEINKLSPSQIQGIVENSLYPVTMIVKDHFKYYEEFDATRFKDKVFNGNLEKNEDIIKQVLMPKNEGTTFLDISFESEDGTVKKDTYDAIFTENQILVNLDNNQFLPITRSAFERVYEGQNVDVRTYPGEVGTSITGGQWNVLSQTIIDAYNRERFRYLNENVDLAVIYPEYIKVVNVINVFGLYFYKEIKYDFVKHNKVQCEEAVLRMLEEGWINEYRTRSLIQLLNVVSDDTVKQVVEYVLKRKDSKELAEVGLNLIKKGYEKGWQKDSLVTMKKFATAGYINSLYKIDSSLGFTEEELLLVEKNILSEADDMRVRAYTSKIENIKSEINRMIGDITTSGVREKMKSLKTKDNVYNNLNTFIKERIAHFKGDYSSLTIEELMKQYNEVSGVYNGSFANIMARLAKEENKA